jgi:hypothetical protein
MSAAGHWRKNWLLLMRIACVWRHKMESTLVGRTDKSERQVVSLNKPVFLLLVPPVTIGYGYSCDVESVF